MAGATAASVATTVPMPIQIFFVVNRRMSQFLQERPHPENATPAVVVTCAGGSACRRQAVTAPAPSALSKM
jgi:hypothetical protein